MEKGGENNYVSVIVTDEISRPRKSLRRTWNQLPRCQRNLIILGILAICVMLFFYHNLPGDQIFVDNEKNFNGALPFMGSDLTRDNEAAAAANANGEADADNADVVNKNDFENEAMPNDQSFDKEDNNPKAVLGPPIFKEHNNPHPNILPPPQPPPQPQIENVMREPQTWKSQQQQQQSPDSEQQQQQQQPQPHRNINHLTRELRNNNSISIHELNIINNNNIEAPAAAGLVPFPPQVPLQPAHRYGIAAADHGAVGAAPLIMDLNLALEEAILDPLAIPNSNGLTIQAFLAQMDTKQIHKKQHFHGANNERQIAVVEAFKHSWEGYRKYAWGHDNLKPISLGWHDWFGLGLTLVDALDTMYIMGLEDEFQEARNWVKDSLVFDISRDVNLFEVTIRVLGGLLSSYHLSGDILFLQKSIELGNRLLPGFMTPSGIPYSDVNLGAMRAHAPKWSPDSSTSEVTTIQLEFRDLSRTTNISIYERVSHAVNEKIHALEKQHGLVPIFINTNTGTFRSYSTISLGARGDSYYEYLLKQWLQTGRKENDFLINDYMHAIDGVLTQLMRRTPREQHVYIGELINGKDFKPKMDHLTCYLPGTLLLGHKNGMPDSHLLLARDLLETCYQTYMRQPTHLAPEISYFALNDNEEHDIYVKPNDAHNLLRPEFIESLYYFYALTGNRTYQEMGWNIFQAFEKYTKVAAGYTSISNVKNVFNTKMRDLMESFWLGETLKYFYLLFSDNPKEIDLDKWIFNTEAHLVPMRNS